MKHIYIIFLIFLTSSAFSQKRELDTIRLENLNNQLKLFISDIGKLANNIDSSENVKDINSNAVIINEKSIVVIDSINNIFHISDSDDDLIDAGMYYGLAGAFSGTPISAVYSGLAANSTMNSKKSLNYYENIKAIRDISRKMSKQKKIKKLKKMNFKLLKILDELNKIE